jgi:hypothetical protein
MGKVRRAGEVISGNLAWTPETEATIREAFSVANQWRDSHAFPMHSMRSSLSSHIWHRNLNGFSVARLKRMNAIRRKLRRMDENSKPLGLNHLQDLGGCRAIMNTMEDVDGLVTAIRERFRHEYRGENDYIHKAKPDGYRSHHFKFGYKGRGDSVVHDQRRIEIQIRTTLQHSWATAVEAVGLFRGEDLKSGRGSAEWLRLFQLISAEFAEAERCDPAAGMPAQRARMRELKELNGELGAASMLNSLSHAVRWVEDAVAPQSRAAYYLIRYDNESRQVTVSPYFQVRYAFQSYEDAENPDNISGLDTANIVLVEADKMDNLTRAYPNYFGDVQLFKMQLTQLVQGQPVREYEVELQQRAAARARESADPSWIGRRGMWFEPKRKR